MWGIIATWRMAYEGIEKASEMLREGKDAGDAIETAVREVEDFPYYKSVGYGGLPNEEMEVELDAAYMDGDTLDIGAVAAIRDFANPVSIARRLSKEPVNNLLVGEGAEKYAHKEGFERKNMLTDRAKIHYRNRKKEIAQTEIKRAVEAGYFEIEEGCSGPSYEMPERRLWSATRVTPKGQAFLIEKLGKANELSD